MNQSVIKALQLLNLFTGDEMELSLADIARKADLPKPTAYRLLSSLETCGFLTKTRRSDQDIRYHLGLKLLELGNVVSNQLELRKIALPHMQRLSRDIDEVIHLLIVEGNDAVYIEKVESKQAVRLYTRVGKRFPLYVGSGPKLLLAYLPDPERDLIVQNLQLKPLTKNTIVDKVKLRQEIARIREQGFATSEGEQDLSTVGISFPVKDSRGDVIAALGVSVLSVNFAGERHLIVKEKTRLAALSISADLGYTPTLEREVRTSL